MGRAAFDDEVAFLATSSPAAAVLCRTPQGNLHMGILYRSSEGHCEVLHLAWNDNLQRAWPWRRLWASPEIEPERLRALAGQCRQIWRRYQASQRFAYALAYRQTTFDVSGSVVLGPGARGLTCATFVLALFNSLGIVLIDEDDWPVRTADDLEFLAGIEGFTTHEHLEVLRREVDEGCKRIRPEEVLGACACADLPAQFAPTRAHADAIVARLA